MKIAFIGLGNMGGPMACNIARSEHCLSVFDLNPARMDVVVAAGHENGRVVRKALSIADAAGDADVVMTSLPNPKAIETVAFDQPGLINAMKQGSTWIDLSTGNLHTERRIRSEADQKGVCVLDCPVTGGVEGAEAGTLRILGGGDAEVFARHEALLQLIGSKVSRIGPNGAGYVAKISQVVLCYLNSVALAEALTLGVKGGVEADTMLEIIQESTGTSYVARRYGPALLDGTYDPGFALGLAHKDLALALELGASVDATLPLCASVEDIYRRAVEEYGFDQNHLMAVRLLEEQNQTFLRSQH